jgi:structural toxin protein (hemagglutinin/hemolysin) RtxA
MSMYKISVYIPSDYLEAVKLAMFDQGAGRLGNYDHCAWQVLGRGQFRPLAQSNPFKGQKGNLETLDEYLVEMICDKKCIKPVIAALKKSHPYEEPAFAIVRLEDFYEEIKPHV